MDDTYDSSTDSRLEQLESQIEALMGHVKALEYGLRIVIATHPEPDVVLHALDRITGDALAPSSPAGKPATPMYQAALQQGLNIVREQVTESHKWRP